MYDAEEVKDAESEWVAKYQEKGFGILNDFKQLGRTGTDKRIHTNEIIFKEAKKYKTRVDFKTKSPKIYDAACTQRLLDVACSHMRGIKEKNYWTKEKCIEFAKNCKDRSEFVKAKNGAYESSKDNQWLDEIYSFLKKLLEEKKNYRNLEENFKKILIVMSPVIPHITSECLNKIGEKNNLEWPKVDKDYLKSNKKVIVIQINGKKRNTIEITEEIDEKKLLRKIKEMKVVEKYINNQTIIKTIYVKNKLINIIIK